MRFYRSLDHVLGTRLKVAILRTLTADSLELNGRQIALAVGASPKPLNQALAQLTSEGVLVQRNVGRTHLFRMNLESPLVTDFVVPLFRREATLLQDALREALAGVPGLCSAILYGSLARGEEGSFSDVDLLVVAVDEASAQAVLEARAISFLDRYGNVLSFTVLSQAEFRNRYLERDEFVHEVARTGRVVAGQLPLETVYGSA